MQPDYTYKAKLIRVVDGDTIIANIDMGFRMWAEMPIRLYGIDTPERGEVGWSEAKKALQSLLTGQDLTIKTFKNPEKYGRWLGMIWIGNDLHRDMVNDMMISSGLAKVYGS